MRFMFRSSVWVQVMAAGWLRGEQTLLHQGLLGLLSPVSGVGPQQHQVCRSSGLPTC